MHYILYKTTNKVNGSIYVGVHKTDNLDDGYLGSGKLLKRAIKKHGKENFEREVLQEFDNPEEMYQSESILVNEDFVTRKDTYNLKEGGEGGFDYINAIRDFKEHNQKLADNRDYSETDRSYITEDFKQRKSLIMRALIDDNIINPGTNFLGKKHTNEAKKKIGEANSKHQSGKGNSQYGTMWIHNTKLKESKRISKNEPIPKGWGKGRKMKFD